MATNISRFADINVPALGRPRDGRTSGELSPRLDLALPWRHEFHQEGVHTRESICQSPRPGDRRAVDAEQPGRSPATASSRALSRRDDHGGGGCFPLRGSWAMDSIRDHCTGYCPCGTKPGGGQSIQLKGCDDVVVLSSAGTDYIFDYSNIPDGEDPHAA